MTYSEFKNKYNGKYIDYDGSYGSQCWDLAEFYFTQVLKLPASVLARCGLVSNMLYNPKRKVLDKYFYEIDLKSARQGDVAIWEYGHIAIVDSNINGCVKYFSQNPNPCQVMSINIKGVHIFRLRNGKKEDYFEINKTYELQYNINLRTSPYVRKGNIPKIKDVDNYTKKLCTSKNPYDNAVIKKGVFVEPLKLSFTDNRVWISYGNCWLCAKDSDGTLLIKKVI